MITKNQVKIKMKNKFLAFVIQKQILRNFKLMQLYSFKITQSMHQKVKRITIVHFLSK